jgi:hypothetical protein
MEIEATVQSGIIFAQNTFFKTLSLNVTEEKHVLSGVVW